MMGDFKVLGIIIILLCEGVQNTELKGPHFLNLFERVLEPSPPLFESPSLRRPQEWASAFRNYWSSLIRNRLPIIGWGATGTGRPHLEEEIENAAEDVKNMDIDAPIITGVYDADKVSSGAVPSTGVEVYNTNGEFMPFKVTEVKPSSGVTVTDIKFTNTPPVKVVSVPFTTLEIPLNPPAASYPNQDLQTSTQPPSVPTKQPSLLEILLEDYLCKSSSYTNCEYLVNIKHEQHPGKPHPPELPLLLTFRKPSTGVANDDKKGPYSNTPAPYYQVNIKDILGPQVYTNTVLKPQHHEYSSHTPIGTSYTTEKEVTTNIPTTPYTPVDTPKHTTQASYTTAPARDKTSSYTHSKIPEVTTYSTVKELTTEVSTTTHIPEDVTEYTSKTLYTTLPTTEMYHKTTSFPKTDSPKVSSYHSNKETTTEAVTTTKVPADVIEYTTKGSYTTIPTRHYHEETTTHPSTYTINPTTHYHEETTTHPSTYTTIPTTHYHEETTTHPSTYTTIPTTHYHQKTTTYPSRHTTNPTTHYHEETTTHPSTYTTIPTTHYHQKTTTYPSRHTTNPTTHYYEETTTHPSTYTTIPTTHHHQKTTTYPSRHTTNPTTHYHEETTTHPSTYTTIPTTHHHQKTTTYPSRHTTNPTTHYYEETTTHPSTTPPYYSTYTPKKETTTDSASTSYTKVDKTELTSQASYITVPTTEYPHETSSHTPAHVTKVSTEGQTSKIPIRHNDKLTHLNPPIKHSSESSYSTFAIDSSKYTTTKMPETSTHASYTTTPQISTTEIKSSYTQKATTEFAGIYTTPTPSSEKYSMNTAENTERYTTNTPYSESTVTSATLSELSYDRPLTVALNDNSDQQIEDVPKKQNPYPQKPLESVPSIPQPPYNLSPYYIPSNSYPNIPYPQQGVWNYGNGYQAYPYPYYYPQM